MWRNDIKCKYMFMFSLKNLARKGLIFPYWWDPARQQYWWTSNRTSIIAYNSRNMKWWYIKFSDLLYFLPLGQGADQELAWEMAWNSGTHAGMEQNIGQVVAFHLFCAKPIHEPVLIYCQLDHQEQTSVTFESKHSSFHSGKCISKCLQKVDILFRPQYMKT